MATRLHSTKSPAIGLSIPTNPTCINLPASAKLSGQLYRTTHPDYLLEDLIQVELRTGICIDVGWYPARDPRGSYCVVVFDGTWDKQRRTVNGIRNFDEMVSIVESIAKEFSRSITLASGTTSTVYVDVPHIYASNVDGVTV